MGDLLGGLPNIDTPVATGAVTSVCVLYTVSGYYARGHKVMVPMGAVIATDKEDEVATIHVMAVHSTNFLATITLSSAIAFRNHPRDNRRQNLDSPSQQQVLENVVPISTRLVVKWIVAEENLKGICCFTKSSICVIAIARLGRINRISRIEPCHAENCLVRTIKEENLGQESLT